MYLAFVGEKAITGVKNPRSGRRSRVGNLKAFSTRKLRDEYYKSYRSYNPSLHCWKTNPSQAKSRFCAGWTQDFYNEFLLNIEVISSTYQENSFNHHLIVSVGEFSVCFNTDTREWDILHPQTGLMHSFDNRVEAIRHAKYLET
jgi:hypothetical protein